MDWRLYAIYRLEHWGLSSINNSDVNDAEILEANRIYGSLGELAVMVMPQAQLNTVRALKNYTSICLVTPGKNNLFRKSLLKPTNCAMKTVA